MSRETKSSISLRKLTPNCFCKVFVVSLPRCATVSMCEALSIIGVRVAHLGKVISSSTDVHYDKRNLQRIYEQISQGDYNLEILKDCDGLADYPACSIQAVKALDLSYPGSLFINVRRDQDIEGWLRSVEVQFTGLQLINSKLNTSKSQSRFLETMLAFRQMTFGQADFDPSVFHTAYLRFQRELANYFKGRPGDLLEFSDVSQLEREGFEQLSRFFNCETPEAEFPKNNSHSKEPREAFFSAVSTGLIEVKCG